MPGVVAPAPREQGWTRVVIATVVFLLFARAPGARALLPVMDTYLLLFPALTACFVAGWAAGGPGSLAFVWTLMTAALFALPSPGGSAAYYDVARAWGLFVAGGLGVVCIVVTRGTFLRRAFAAVGVAVIGAGIFAGAAALSPSGLARVFAGEFAARNAASAATFARFAARVSAVIPSAAAWAAAKTVAIGEASAVVASPLVPALLVLEALTACALAWALYHRFSRARLGPPLASLRQFTFGHEVVWPLILGGLLVAVPTVRGGDAGRLGANLVVLFGALFALRGAGVAAWFVPVRRAAAQCAALLAALALAPITVPAALGLGVADNWLDWRGLARSPSPAAPSID